MGAAYVAGLWTALRRWALVLVLLLVNLLSGLGFTAVAWSWLSMALDSSLATRTLLADLDVNVFVDLFVHHGDSLRMLLVAAGVMAVFFILVGVWLNAVTVVAVGDDAGTGECMRRGFSLYPAYARLWLLATVMNAISVGVAFLIGRGLTRWLAESPSEMSFYWAVAAGAVAGAVLLLFFVTVHDHARIRSAATGAGAVRAYVWAIRFVGKREWRAVPLAAILTASGIAVWAVYQTVGMLVATDSSPGVVLSLAWGETFLLARTILRVWFFAAETELQNIAD
ncbi:MAG: hypothetical protein ACE5I7_18735 [Candidatus Binatia bacterium]